MCYRRGNPVTRLSLAAAIVTATLSAADLIHPWRPDDSLRRLLMPPAMPPDTYRVFVTDQPIETVATHYRRVVDGLMPPPGNPGQWRAERQSFAEAIGPSGIYDRAKVARLYGGRGPMVAGGTIRTPAATESVILVSPYPNAQLSRLESGTMIVVFRIP